MKPHITNPYYEENNPVTDWCPFGGTCQLFLCRRRNFRASWWDEYEQFVYKCDATFSDDPRHDLQRIPLSIFPDRNPSKELVRSLVTKGG